MKKKEQKIIICICLVLLLFSWLIAIIAKSDTEKQLELIRQALTLIDDEIYVRAVPLLEEAAEYRTIHTFAAENELKRAYLALSDTRGYQMKYVRLLERQLGKNNIPREIYREAALYYLSKKRYKEAFETFKNGIAETDCPELTELYEQNRYIYEVHRTRYDYVSEIYNGHLRVKKDELWGMINTNGKQIIPCMYEQISAFSNNRVIVQKNGAIFAVDSNNNRIAVFSEDVDSSSFFTEVEQQPDTGLTPVKAGEYFGYSNNKGDMVIEPVFHEAKNFVNGSAPVRTDFGWNIITLVERKVK